MALRKRPSPAISQAGQSERPRDPAVDDSLAQPVEPRAEYGKVPPEAAPEAKPDVSSLKSQLDQMRSHAQPDPLDQYIAVHFQGALPAERQWLRDRAHDRPHYFADPRLVHQAGMLALQDGVARQSPEFVRAIGKKLDDHFAAMQARAASAPPAPPPAAMPEPQHVAHVDVEHGEHDRDAQEDHTMPEHVSAPVSRDPSQYAVEYQPSEHSIRLTAEERDIAARSGISETQYAAGKLKLARMKKSKLISE